MRVVLQVGEIQLGKNLVRLDWEKAVYRLLFTLVNTLRRQYNFIHIAQYFCVYPVFQQDDIVQRVLPKARKNITGRGRPYRGSCL